MNWNLNLNNEPEIIKAAGLGNLEELKLYLSSNLKPEELNKKMNTLASNNATPLAVAVYFGHLDCVEFLCKLGADLNFNIDGTTLIHLASKVQSKKKIELIKFLMSNMKNAKEIDLLDPEITSTKEGCKEIIENRLCHFSSEGYPITRLKMNSTWVPAIFMFKYDVDDKDCITFFKFLTDFHKDIKIRESILYKGTDHGATPFLIASGYGNLDILQFIYDRDPTVVDDISDNHNNALHSFLCLVRTPHPSRIQCLKFLIAIGVDTEILNKYRSNPYSYLLNNKEMINNKELNVIKNVFEAALRLNNRARKLNNIPVKELLKNGAHLNQRAKGLTPLHIAILENSYDCVGELLDCGADLSLKNKEGQNAIELALANKKDQMFLLLFCYAHANQRLQDQNLNTEQSFVSVFQTIERIHSSAEYLKGIYLFRGFKLTIKPGFALEAYCLLTKALSFQHVNFPSSSKLLYQNSDPLFADVLGNINEKCNALLADLFLSGRLRYQNHKVIAINENQLIHNALQADPLSSSSSSSKSEKKEIKENREIRSIGSEDEETLLRGLYHLCLAGNSEEVVQQRIKFTNILLRVPIDEIRFGDIMQFDAILKIVSSSQEIEKNVVSLKQEIENIKMLRKQKQIELQQEQEKLALLAQKYAHLTGENEILEQIAQSYEMSMDHEITMDVSSDEKPKVQSNAMSEPTAASKPAPLLISIGSKRKLDALQDNASDSTDVHVDLIDDQGPSKARKMA